MTDFILGADPGLAHFGVAIADVHRSNGSVKLGLRTLYTIETVKCSAKTRILQANDNTRRVRELARHLLGLVRDGHCLAICTESASSPRNSSSNAKLHMGCTVLATVAEMWECPIAEVRPQDLKKALTGKAKASKVDIQQSLLGGIYGKSVSNYLLNSPKKLHEHACDALAAIVACLDSDIIRAVLRGGK